ncbi:DNA ligase LigA-related protein [Paenibacillus sp. Soil724D2]|uniref:DNA ligase LigA-related protein n=1 Tax=Paenibacillus sp. (strain Soil724D2) TaxID=1736392 RepID=UPI0007125FB9|nr:hypothetical protein [Paenibacillus sp. Soil724D2]KRE33455.1 hypothetical protein ASG85_14405 [Paenibacillus sp. Soil724D2]
MDVSCYCAAKFNVHTANCLKDRCNTYLINSLRKSFLINSYLYYHLDKSLISDNLFNARAKQLAALHKQYPEIVGVYQEYFDNFDPSTGYDIPVDDWIMAEAERRLSK